MSFSRTDDGDDLIIQIGSRTITVRDQYVLTGGVAQDQVETIEYGSTPSTLDTSTLFAGEVHGTGAAETVNGTTSGEIIRGFAGNDTIYGDDGNDTIYGSSGNDTIYGGNGDDILYGEAGNDILIGGIGTDTFTGGSNADTVVFESGSLGTGVDYISEFSGVTIDLRNLLQNYDSAQDAITDFIALTTVSGDTTIAVDSAGTSNFTDLVLVNSSLGSSVENLIAAGKLIVD